MKRLNEKQWRDETDKKSNLLLKAVETEVTESKQERVLNFRISTETVDSYGDVIKADGWDLKRYEKNPVVLWAHDHRQPAIGKALSIGVEGTDLVTSAEFADMETYAFADTIFRLLKGKFMRATSVGFFPRAWTEVKDDERWGYDFTDQELYEFSVVPVPANPDALMAAVSDGIDCAPLKDWAEQTLDLWTPEASVALWIPRAQIEGVYKSLTPEPVVSVTPKPPEILATVTTVETKTVGDLSVKTEETTVFTPDPDVKVTAPNLTGVFDADGNIIEPVLKGTEETAPPFSKYLDLHSTITVLSDEIESLKAETDQLRTKLAETEKKQEVEEDSGELFDVIDIQPIDSHAVENEIDLAILDLDLDPETLQKVIVHQLECEMMKTTGKLPKEV